ncbi:MAG TPA: 23S rRNA (pseudouridine(1915)-N(3))-methyltransferase RlmH [Gammaproteobacteria bacterium]|nr:23S rRNA (pseudouridine(1915)-N(3))-methyltransferase RlmH [Gammaproteobacteria bacterium]
MHIYLIAAGNRMPAWVEEAYKDYASRLPKECSLNLLEINPGKRYKGADIDRIGMEEGERILAAIPKSCQVIALDVGGKAWSTEQLAGQLENWMQSGQDVALLVGGPEGLSDACYKRAGQRWSLSPLTLPHPMVRVILAEQMFRAWSIIARHPYHR